MIGQKWWLQALRTVIGPDDHQLVQVLGIRELGHRRRRDVAAAEHLVQVHLGDAARRVLGVVVALGVDHQAFEHALHLAVDFVEQRVELARLEKSAMLSLAWNRCRACWILARIRADTGR